MGSEDVPDKPLGKKKDRSRRRKKVVAGLAAIALIGGISAFVVSRSDTPQDDSSVVGSSDSLVQDDGDVTVKGQGIDQGDDSSETSSSDAVRTEGSDTFDATTDVAGSGEAAGTGRGLRDPRAKFCPPRAGYGDKPKKGCVGNY